MDYVNEILLLANQNQVLIFVLAILVTFLESFIPAFPLLGIVIGNALLLGFLKGIIASTIGSSLGTISLFLIFKSFGESKFFLKYKNNKVEKVTDWIKNQNKMILYICYASSFVPSCLISISSGISDMKLRDFAPSMILGKISLFFVASYIGNDLEGVIKSPIKLTVIILIFVFMFIVANKVNKKMEEKNE